MLAVDRGCDTTLVDFLIANGVSPVETDTPRGYVFVSQYFLLLGLQAVPDGTFSILQVSMVTVT